MHHLLAGNGTHLGRALVGSEGTCAITVGATLSLVPDPPEKLLVLLGYPDMAAAADAVPGLLPHRATAIVADAGAIEHRIVSDQREAAQLWRIREDGSGLVARAGRRPAHAGWEDAAVPPGHLGAYLREFEELLGSHGLTGVPYGHFGDGCVHVRIDFPLGEPDGTAVFRSFLRDAARFVASHGGSISGEHGDGRARSELLSSMYSEAAIAAFAAFKAACDPDDVLNPGVVVRPRPLDADLRADRRAVASPSLGFGLADDAGSFDAAVHRCTGIGRCVTGRASTGTVMCPSYLATGDERDSTRGRARVLQEMVVGSLVEGGFRAPEVHDALDLCLACKGCASDCPTGTDVATYKAEVLHQTYRRRLRPRSHYTLGWLPRWARVAGLAPRLASRILAFGPVARLAKASAGVDPRRPIPVFASPDATRPARTARPLPGQGDERCGPERSGAALGRHVHRTILAGGGRRGGRGDGGCGLRGRGGLTGGVLRADMDLHGPARCCPPHPQAHDRRARRARRSGHPHRRAGAVPYRRAPFGCTGAAGR